MLKSSNKKFKPAEIGDTVLIPISQPDTVDIGFSDIGYSDILDIVIYWI